MRDTAKKTRVVLDLRGQLVDLDARIDELPDETWSQYWRRRRSFWKPKEFTPPFDFELVQRALLHFQSTGEPLLEYRLETYDEVVRAVDQGDHFELEGPPSHDDPWDAFRSIHTWADLGKLCGHEGQAAIEYFDLEERWGEWDDDGNCTATDERLLSGEPDSDDLMDHAWGCGDFVSAEAAAIRSLNPWLSRVFPLPLGSVGITEGGCPGGDAPPQYVLSPKPALTFLQTWLDHLRSGVRVEVGPTL